MSLSEMMSGETGYGWWWVAAGLILSVLEIFAPGSFMLWVGIAAMMTGFLTMAADPAVEVQFMLFAVLAVLNVVILRTLLRRFPIVSAAPLLNRRGDQLVGQTLKLIEPIEAGTGRARVGDTAWLVRGPDMPNGRMVKVIGVEGAQLVVAPVNG